MKCMINILIIFILYSTLISCEKKAILSNDKKELSDSLIRPLGNLGFGADSLSCKLGCSYGMFDDRRDCTFVINNNTDYNAFKKFVSCLEINSWPSVDFKKNTMLAGIRIMGASCSRLIPEKFSLTKNNANYKIVIAIRWGLYWSLHYVPYWVLTDKISADSYVEFLIEEYDVPHN
jgi:hypothetical protein